MKASSFVFILWLASPALAQDLFERQRRDGTRESSGTSAYRSRDRLDWQLSADATTLLGKQTSGSSSLGVSGYVDYDFACGRFDLKSNLQQLINKEAAEDFLGDALNALLGEMAHNSMVLICETSPTICQALQHYRISANAMLGMQYDWCSAIEAAVDDSNQSTRAKAIKDCIEKKRAEGLTLDQAREACENPDKIRGLDGRFVSEIDILEELRRAFNLPKVDQDILSQLISSLRYSPKGGEGEIKANAALDRHQQLVDQFTKAWNRALERKALTEDDLAALSPDGASRVSAIEVAEIAALSPGRRELVVRTIVSSAAIFQLTMELGKAIKLLDAARKHPTADKGFVQRLENERDDLERQLEELTRLHELQERHNRTLLDATSVAQADLVTKGTKTILAETQKDQGKKILKETPRWGTFPERCCEVKRGNR